MKKYTFSFRGRQAGAIGIFYQIIDTYKADSISEAKSLLYEDYEHIQGLKIISGATQQEFDKAEFIKVRSNTERERDAKTGTYL